MGAHQAVAEPVDRADEAHHELVGGHLVEVARRANLLDPAVVENHDLLRHLHRLFLVVRDEDRGHVDLLVQAPQPGPQLLAHRGVERAEGLVEQQHARLDGERPGERHALTLAAGELGRVAVGEAFQVDEAEQLVDPVARLVLGGLADLEAEGDVVAHRHVLERRVVLKDEADAALAGGGHGRVLAGDEHAAAVRVLQARDHAQQRRLAAAARPEQRRQRSVRDLERHVVERDEVAEVLRGSLHLDAHRVPSLGLKTFMASSVPIAIRARTTAAA